MIGSNGEAEAVNEQPFDILAYLMGKAGGGGGGSYPWFGPGTEKLDTKQQIINLADDTTWASWTPSTTAGTILAAPSSYQYEWSVDLGHYDYYIVSRYVTKIALKESATRVKILTVWGRVYISEVFGLPVSYNGWQSDVRGTTQTANNSALQNAYYYNSTGELAFVSNTGAAPMSVSSAPASIATWPSTIKFKRPDIKAQCSSSYFDTARAGDIDADNTNMTIDVELYRTPIAGSLMAVEIERLRQAMNA